MDYQDLVHTDLRVSRLGLGGSHLKDTEDHRTLLNVAIERGINLFDTADSYGQGASEALLRDVIKGRRNRVLIATKIGYSTTYLGALIAKAKALAGRSGDKKQTFATHYLGTAVRQSLKRLGTDYVDIVYLHNPPESVIRSIDVWTCLQELKQMGLLRYFGVSCKTVADAEFAASASPYTLVQCETNVAHADRYPNLCRLAVNKGIALIGRQPFASGKLIGAREKYRSLEIPGRRTFSQAALRYALQLPAVASVIVRTGSVKHLEENIAALEAPSLSEADLALIESLADGSDTSVS